MTTRSVTIQTCNGSEQGGLMTSPQSSEWLQPPHGRVIVNSDVLCQLPTSKVRVKSEVAVT